MSAATSSVSTKPAKRSVHWAIGRGKTTAAIAMLTGPYRNCYSRVYVFSPSCAPGVDPAWDAWRKHVRVHMRVPDEGQTM